MAHRRKGILVVMERCDAGAPAAQPRALRTRGRGPFGARAGAQKPSTAILAPRRRAADVMTMRSGSQRFTGLRVIVNRSRSSRWRAEHQRRRGVRVRASR
jgi:hypothetical protein